MADTQNSSTFGDHEGRKIVTGREAIAAVALDVARLAQREIAVYSNQLAGEFFSGAEFLDTLRQLAIATPHTRVRILVRNPTAAVRNAPQVLELCRQLSSKVGIRAVAPEHRNRQVTFIIADDRALVYHPSPDSNEAVVEAVPGTARHYLNAFEVLWESGSTEPDFRQAGL